jgi:cyanophycinase
MVNSSISEPRVKVDAGCGSGLLQKDGSFMVRAILLVYLLLVCGASSSAFGQESPEYGPASGTLVIVGGGHTGAILNRFIDLAGGKDARLIVVPTAGGNTNGQGQIKVYKESEVIAPWLKLGLKNVRMLHTHDRKVADTEAFVKDLRKATAVWFMGGRQWNLVDSYAGTLTEKEFHRVLARGGVIGGSSAGATIQGDYLVRGDVAGPQIMMTADPRHQHGFGFLRRSAIDQHVDTRNRWDDLIPVIKKYPELLGLGLSEATAVIVQGDTFDVLGKGKVAVHDNTKANQTGEKPYILLSSGDRYNMKSRQVLTLGR